MRNLIGLPNNGGVKTSEAIAFFGSKRELANRLKLAPPSVYCWAYNEAEGKPYPPPLRQLQIEALTGGALKAEPDCDKFRFPSREAA